MILGKVERRARLPGDLRLSFQGNCMSETDKGLVGKARHGDQAAFEEIVRRTSRLVFARLYRVPRAERTIAVKGRRVRELWPGRCVLS